MKSLFLLALPFALIQGCQYTQDSGTVATALAAAAVIGSDSQQSDRQESSGSPGVAASSPSPPVGGAGASASAGPAPFSSRQRQAGAAAYTARPQSSSQSPRCPGGVCQLRASGPTRSSPPPGSYYTEPGPVRRFLGRIFRRR